MTLSINDIAHNWVYKTKIMTVGQMDRSNLWYKNFEMIKSYHMVIAKRFELPDCTLCLIAEPKVSSTTNRHISRVCHNLITAKMDVVLEVPQSFSPQGRDLIAPYTNIHSIWKAFIACAKHHLWKATTARSRKPIYINDGLRALAGANLISRSFAKELPDDIRELRATDYNDLMLELRTMAAMELLKKA